MLKIKDNIDLKELEKYGFIKQQVGMDLAYARFLLKGYYKESIIVWLDRKIQVDAIETLDILYDLIKADLVEKVGDKEQEEYTLTPDENGTTQINGEWYRVDKK